MQIKDVMCEGHLATALLEEARVSSRADLTELGQFYFDYAVSSNKRGETLISKLVTDFVGPLKNKRYLDIGSGYGGCTIAAAKRGYSAVGLEISDRTRSMAEKNLLDFPGLDVRFLAHDITSYDAVRALGNFDIITSDNVIEHVGCAAALVSNASQLLNPGGLLYITAPNARSVGMVSSECHYKMSAASLMSPKIASKMLGKDYDVTHYFDYRQYVELFDRYGLSVQQILPQSATPEKAEAIFSEALLTGLKCRADHKLSPLSPFIIEALEKWEQEFTADIQFMRRSDPITARKMAHTIERDYGFELWYFVARK